MIGVSGAEVGWSRQVDEAAGVRDGCEPAGLLSRVAVLLVVRGSRDKSGTKWHSLQDAPAQGPAQPYSPLPCPLTDSPAGFTCQLLQWQKRRALNAPARIRLYRMAPHCPQAPLILVR